MREGRQTGAAAAAAWPKSRSWFAILANNVFLKYIYISILLFLYPAHGEGRWALPLSPLGTVWLQTRLPPLAAVQPIPGKMIIIMQWNAVVVGLNVT